MKIFNKKSLIYLLVIVLIVAIVFFISSLGKNDFETVEVKGGNLEKIVEISGKVVAAEEVNLSFNASGNVTKVYKDVGDKVKAGDVLAEIDSSEISNEILEAQANLQSAQAELNKISGEGSYSQVQLARETLLETMNKAFVVSDSGVRNSVDTFFNDADTINAEFILSVGSKNKIFNDNRESIERVLDEWYSKKNSLDENDVSYVLNNIKKVESFVSLISGASSEFKSETSVSQTQIDSYVSALSTVRSNLASVKLEVNSAFETLNNFKSDIPIQNAKINNTKATVNRLQTKTSDYVLRAPFDGLVTENNLEIGKYTDSTDIAFVLISDSPLEIEVYIPEINIVGVDVSDNVQLTFDALEGLVIDAVVTHIDPKETIKDGVVTYRTLIGLISPNDNLRPGMTADAKIEKEVVSGELIIPTYTISDNNEGQFVKIKNGEEIKEVRIEIIDKDNIGNVSVQGDLKVGDKIIIPKES